MEEYGNEFSMSLLQGFPCGRADKPSLKGKVFGIFRKGIFSLAQGDHVGNRNILVGFFILHHGIDENCRLRYCMGKENSIAGLDLLNCFFCRALSFFIDFFPFHYSITDLSLTLLQLTFLSDRCGRAHHPHASHPTF